MTASEVAEVLAKVITEQLGLYTLPANYAAPYTMLGKERDHWEVAENCGPLIAQRAAEVLTSLIEERVRTELEAEWEAVHYGLCDFADECEEHTNPHRRAGQ